MTPTKIMIIRHAEKPGIYNKVLYNGIDAVGKQDPSSLVTMGWERAGGIASLFDPTGALNPPTDPVKPGLAVPNYIYASSPVTLSPVKYNTEPNGNMVEEETSKRPYQTISALAAKLAIAPANLITSFVATDYYDMVKDVLTRPGTVLIAWQHQDILPKTTTSDSIIYELFCQTKTINVQTQAPIPANFNVPAGPWPPARYDMVFVIDLDPTTGIITSFKQHPQQLLPGDGDVNSTFPLPWSPNPCGE